MKTKIVSLILAVAMLLSFASFYVMAEEAQVLELSDVSLDTKEGEAVNRLVSLGIINGYPDGTFKPGNTITRAEFCVVMVKFEGLQDFINPEAKTGFDDLDTDENYAWARPYVAMAVQRGIINGFEDKTFRAAEAVTYEQAIKMIVCSLGYASSSKPTIAGDWSSGYMAKAMQLRITNNTSITNKSNATTRGTVAILVNNALNAPRQDFTTGDGNVVIEGGDGLSNLDYTEVKGIVTGTFITELETGKSTVPRNHIMIDDEVYEIGFSENPNNFLGCHVEALIKDADHMSDYPLVTSLEPTNKTDVVTVEAGLVIDYDGEYLYYFTDSDKDKDKKIKIEEDYLTIFNNKAYEYDITDLKDELKSGSVEFVDNDGDNRYEVVRIHSYDVFVVYSKSNSTQKITLMYDAEYEGEPTIVFPEDSTSLIFSLTRNGKDIKFSDIAKWDVLNIKESPSDAEGRKYYEVVVTRDSVSGEIQERDPSDESYVVIKDKEYYIADSFLEYDGEDKPSLEVGDNAQVYLDAQGKIVAAAETTSGNSAENYAYMFSLRQDSDASEYDLEFWLYTTSGKELMIGSADKITIDGVKYKALDEDLVDYLEDTAEQANATYPDAENVLYQQPIRYQTNSEGLVSVIYTVNSSENEDISMVMNGDEDPYFVAYEERQYKSSSKSFTDFKVSSSTKIIFVPDNRGNTDDYLTFKNYGSAFSNGRKYHVEAFGCTSSGTAALVLLYSQNDSRIYTSASPWMIVASKSQTSTGTVIKGYLGTSYSEKKVTVSEEDGPSSISDIGKGDIIRYIVDSKGELIDYQIWFDASNPSQLEPVSTNDDLYVDEEKDETGANRILEIHSTSTEPRKNYPNATFRLQYGTVTELILKSDDDDSVDEESITVSPVIVEDELEMDYFEKEDTSNNSTVSKAIGSSVKVFSYDRGGRGSDVVTEASLEEILDYETYAEDATRVIIYTASGSLRMIYIVTD